MESQRDTEKEGCTEDFLIEDDDEYVLDLEYKHDLEDEFGKAFRATLVKNLGEGSLPAKQVLEPNITEQEVSEETLEALNFTLKKERDMLGLRDREAVVWDTCKVKICERG
ncbi:hypothetical protein NDU88_010678 [Pleurodeles waltl]|uniref:Uncharacterized protein n=1 Tax=Pleurodeles waltl TaxID=8319 RepID=A0AAV7QZH3_PLEWA|nr:hypothetical protein NDU88_010678 [Pleurodeles waltl]